MKDLTNAQFIETLRVMAEFYEAHPTAPIPSDFHYGWLRCHTFGLEPEAVKELLRSLGSFAKEYEDAYFIAKVQVGHITLDFVNYRDKVCTRKVVGTKTVPQQVIPSSYTEEQVIPEHEEEIVEWDCTEAVMRPDTPMVEPVPVAVASDDDIPF